MLRRSLWAAALVASLIGCGPRGDGGNDVATTATWMADTSTLAASDSVRDDAKLAEAQIVIATAARKSRAAYQKLTRLTDDIGNRLSGSEALGRALQWAADAMRADGHENVHIEPVMVPVWIRGTALATAVSSRPGSAVRPLHVLALGGSIAGDVTAPLVVVHSWAELEQRKADVKGAIVLFDVAMPTWTHEHGSGYGDVVGYRSRSAIAAGKLGAVGVLVRSVTARSLSTVHTGAMRYADDVMKIPAASVSVEDAMWLARTTRDGQRVTVRIQLQTQTLPDAASGNVIAELRGRELPNEIVVLGAHIDSWDVGQGAHDDGAGCVIMMQALTTLRQLGLTPRRTIRVVLYTNEENGIRGAKGYAAAHAAEMAQHVAALESDSGGFAPEGFELELTEGAPPAQLQRVQQQARSLLVGAARVGAGRLQLGEAGTDIGPLVAAGVPGFGLAVDNRSYFDIHHTEADTLDKVDPQQLADGVAAVASFAYGLAERKERLVPASVPVPVSVPASVPVPVPVPVPASVPVPAPVPPPVPVSTPPAKVLR